MNNNYVLVTAAKNEEKYIENNILSVMNQTQKPIKWIIIDDGSEDLTQEIIRKYITVDFIELLQNERINTRNFAKKVYAIKKGYDRLKDLNFSFIGILDADITLEPDYYEKILEKFSNYNKLGIAGGKVCDLINGKFIEQRYENHSVSGPIQFFRRNCYESFGGIQPFEIGFEDGHAEISARMNGWETRTFPELKVKHYRPAGTQKGSRLKLFFDGGKIEYLFGYSYIYHLLRNIPRLFTKPYLIGYLITLFGYHSLLFRREKRFVGRDFIRFVRKEQKMRIISSLKNRIKSIKYEY